MDNFNYDKLTQDEGVMTIVKEKKQQNRKTMTLIASDKSITMSTLEGRNNEQENFDMIEDLSRFCSPISCFRISHEF